MPPEETTPETPAEAPAEEAPRDLTPAEREAGVRERLRTALLAFKELHEEPTEKNLEKVNNALIPLGLKPIDTTPGPYNPFRDPRLGATFAIDKLETGVAVMINPKVLDKNIKLVDDEAGASERWAAVFGTIVATALRVGAAFA